MASGVEIAGIVLGSIPLVISALEHYAEGLGTIEKWWRYKRELASLKRILGAECDRFLNTLEELLAGLVPDGKLADLLNSPGGAGWADPDLNQKLQVRLRKSYGSYLDTVNDLNDVVSILKAKLELDPNGKLKWTDSKTFRREYKRIKFSLSKASYEELVKRIEKDNDTLANLTGQSLRLEPTRQKRNNPTPEFERVRMQAESLYRVLKKNLCCSCQSPHNASLRLESRTSSQKTGEGTTLRFKIVFSLDISYPAGKAIAWKRRETEIESCEIRQEAETVTKVILTDSHSNPISPKTIKKGVKFGPEPVILQPPPYSATELAEINDLCLAFGNYKGTETCLGFILDEKLMRHHIYPVTQSPAHQESPNATTLHKRLTSPHTPKTKLRRKESLQLALTLAASVLQLHQTPWLSERWSTHDILFLEGSTGPHISRSFQASAPPTDAADPPKSLPIVRNQTIFALGVILIELCLGTSLASLRTDEDVSPDEQLTDYMTARRLISEVYDEGGGRYGDAVRRCVHCEFDQRKASLDVEAFRTSFFQGVVVPLEEDCMDFGSSMNAM